MKWALAATLTLASAPAWAQLPPEQQPDLPVAANTADKLLEATAGFMKDSYVFPDRVAAIDQKILAHAHTSEYAKQHTAIPLLERLNKDIQDASHDRHLRVVYFHDPLPPPGTPPPATDPHAGEALDAAENFGFRKAEVLDGNIGYLDLRFFPSASQAGPSAVAAMAFLANTQALIVDLRQNHGGDPGTVALILSYFFGEEPVHLNDIYWRPDDSTGQYWTQSYVAGRRYGAPIYVLTGAHTFSAGEEFAYDLQTQHRAITVGQPTGGGAHPITMHRVDDHFVVLIPSGRAINPITHTDWEGTGVKPDVLVAEDQALAKAQALAKEKLSGSGK